MKFPLAGTLLLAVTFSLLAQDTPPPIFAPQFNSQITVVNAEKQTKYGITLYVDGDNYRIEHPQGIFIIRKLEKKTYMLMPQNKLALTMPYTEKEIDKYRAMADSTQTKLLGPESIQGVACQKYQLTSAKGEISYLWADMARQVPVQWTTADGKMMLIFQNYQTGPQNPQLFTVPTDYQSMNMSGQ